MRSSVAIASSYRRRSCSRPSLSPLSSAAITACLARRTAIGGRSAILWARSIARSSQSPSGATSLTRPYRSASAASIRRPVSTSSIARCFPSTRASRCVPPPPGMIPSVISGCPNWAVSDATIRSHTNASSQPPPSAKPETAATSGVLIAARRRQKEAAGWRSDSSKVRFRSERMSAPAANTSSDPAMTTHRTCGSASKPSTAVASSSISSGDSALRASGRFRRQRATLPSRLVSTRPLTDPRAPMSIRAHRRHRVDAGRRAPDDQLVDLRGPLVERRHPGVAQVPLDGVVVDVAGAAVDLDRQVGALDGGLRGVELGDRGFGGVRLALVLEDPGTPDEQLRRVPPQDHLGDHLLDELEARDRDAKLHTVLRVVDRGRHAALADADAPGGDRIAAGLQGSHRDLEAVADLSEQRVVGDLHVVEPERSRVRGPQPELAVDLLRGEPLRLGRDEKAGDPAVSLLRVGLGKDQRHLGHVAERDPHLLAGDPPAPVDLHRARAHRRGIGAGVGLGQPEAAEGLAGAQPRQPLLLLLLRAPALDRAADEGG